MSDTSKSTCEWIDDAIAELKSATWVGQERLVIWGGSFPEEYWINFLQTWQMTLQEQLPWRIEETVSQTVTRNANSTDTAPLPDDAYFIERLRCFGPHGDLDIRRDRGSFHWRFIGDRGEPWPELPAEVNCRDFWETQPEGKTLRFRVVPKQYYQWRRNDRRVSAEWYGPANRGEDLYLEQIHYLQKGQIAFVRCTGFSDGKKEVEHGHRQS
jgi:hypothetical protein